MAVNEEKLKAFVEKVLTDMGAAAIGPLNVIGDQLGLYKAIANNEGLTSDELAKETGTFERYVREWAYAQTAAGYISYDPETRKFSMTPEQAMVFADENNPFFLVGGFFGITACNIDHHLVRDAFKSGKGVAWGSHDDCLFCGTAKFFKPGYLTNLTSTWIPSLDGVEDKLKAGAKVADVGCGHGLSTVIMAKQYPNSTFIGYDFHEESVEAARNEASEAGASNAHFEVADAKIFPGNDFDLIACFDCLHDMGDPVGVSKHIHQALKPDGTWMLVEPIAGDKPEDNFHLLGQMFYSFSTMVCTPASLSQEVGLGLGAQAGEKRLREVTAEGGFTRFRRTSETATNMVLEVRP